VGVAAHVERLQLRVMPAPLKAIAFDVIGTCLSLEPLRSRLVDLGLSSADLELWFARSLRDGFACECAGRFQQFQPVLAGALRALLDSRGLHPGEGSVSSVLAEFAELPPHPDVRPAFERVRAAGLRLALLTNGNRRSTTQAFARHGLDGMLDAVISIDEVRHFKPAAEVYRHAAKRLGVRPAELALVAAHAWDVQGAAAAGLRTGFVRRNEAPSPALDDGGVEADSLPGVLEGLGVSAAPRRSRRPLRIGALAAAAGLGWLALRRVAV
jgi:2-haloacid dehalogenase